jgi:hypothetical protein
MQAQQIGAAPVVFTRFAVFPLKIERQFQQFHSCNGAATRVLFPFWENLKKNFKKVLVLTCQCHSGRDILCFSALRFGSLENLKAETGPPGPSPQRIGNFPGPVLRDAWGCGHFAK